VVSTYVYVRSLRYQASLESTEDLRFAIAHLGDRESLKLCLAQSHSQGMVSVHRGVGRTVVSVSMRWAILTGPPTPRNQRKTSYFATQILTNRPPHHRL
jgi:hypothetical protein